MCHVSDKGGGIKVKVGTVIVTRQKSKGGTDVKLNKVSTHGKRGAM